MLNGWPSTVRTGRFPGDFPGPPPHPHITLLKEKNVKGFVALLAAAALAGLGFTPAPASAQDTGAQATADFIDREGNSVGTALLTETPSGVVINLDLHDLPPGARAIHIHSVGTCEDPEEGFVASGGHLNPDGRPHGLMNPDGPDAGDLPNIVVGDDGRVVVEFFSHLVSLHGAEGRATILDEDGAAFVIHENRDDHITQPIGGAGPRIACGVIRAVD